MGINLYQMYEENGNKAGFWVRRNTWGNFCARVISIGEQKEGKLPGRAPYHGNPPVAAEFFNLHDGSPARWDDTHIRCPGTYTYSMIEPPEWATT